MKIWLISSLAAALFIGWAYLHTDELTVILAFLLAFGFLFGFVFAKYWRLTWVFLGAAAPIAEVLIPTFHLSAPFEGGHPLNASVAFLPALLGTAIGRFSRRIPQDVGGVGK